MRLIRCYACRAFFNKSERACPECCAPVRPVNAGLVSATWKSVLNERARHAVEET